jgi:hypothetical protein
VLAQVFLATPGIVGDSRCEGEIKNLGFFVCMVGASRLSSHPVFMYCATAESLGRGAHVVRWIASARSGVCRWRPAPGPAPSRTRDMAVSLSTWIFSLEVCLQADAAGLSAVGVTPSAQLSARSAIEYLLQVREARLTTRGASALDGCRRVRSLLDRPLWNRQSTSWAAHGHEAHPSDLVCSGRLHLPTAV